MKNTLDHLPPKKQRQLRALADLLRAEAKVELIVHDVKDVNEQLEKGFYFFSDVKKEGIVLHDAGKLQLAEAKERTRRSGERRLEFGSRSGSRARTSSSSASSLE